MSTITVNGKQYDKATSAREATAIAQDIAKNARLLDSPLPADVDFSPAEEKELQTQLNALAVLPPEGVRNRLYNAFTAFHLPALINTLRTLNPRTQPIAFANMVQIFSLLGEPQQNPYLRRFLKKGENVAGIPTLIAAEFVHGIAWKRPSGPGYICSLMCHLLQFCDVSLGDDGESSIDVAVRKPFAEKVAQLSQMMGTNEDLDTFQRVEIMRLDGILGMMEHIGGPPGYYLTSTRDHLRGSSGDDICTVCMEDSTLTCSRCKTVRYCGQKCQKQDWKAGHKLACFQTTY
ncbi:hypothetical protein BDW22DRAFT_1392825 [Trametopsis cervina]|nr:hypothetical protein BDW22DRAFT_1392825 [Trametopsis cervina]